MEKKPVKYILLGLLAAFLIKSLVLPTGINEVCIIAILSGLVIFNEIKPSNKKIETLQEQINQLVEKNKFQDKSIDDMKSSITSVKVASGIRGLTNK